MDTYTVIDQGPTSGEKVDKFYDEHPLFVCSTGAFAFASMAYTLYRIGRGIHRIVKKFRK